MDRTTVFTKTAKGLMEATGKTSLLSRDMRALLKEVDGKATVAELQAKLGKVPEAKLQEALQVLAKNDFVRQFSSKAAPAAAPPPKAPAASDDMDLDFTMAIPTLPTLDKQAEEAAKQKAQAAAAAAARAKAEAEARAKAEAEAAARAKAEAEAKAKARAQAAVQAKAAAEARAKRDAEDRTRREAEERARKEAGEAEHEGLEMFLEARERQETEETAKREAGDRARREAEEKARREADELRAKQEQERNAREEAERRAKAEAERERKEAEEKARREADELRARLEQERRAKEEVERQRKEAEAKAQREADELRAKLEEERKAREEAERRAQEEAERRAQEEAERERKETEEKARREAEARAREEAEEAERKAREEAERRAQEEAERERKEAAERMRREAEEQVRREAEEQARREAEEQARREAEERAKAEEQARKEAEEAERKAKEEAERARREAEEQARREAEEQARREAEEQAQREAEARAKAEEQARKEAEEAERKAKEEAERARREAEEQARREAEEQARREAEEQAQREAEERAKAEEQARIEAEETERRVKEEAGRDAAQQPPAPVQAGTSLDDLVKIDTDFDALLSTGGGAPREAPSAEADDKLQKEAEESARRQAEEQAEAQAGREAEERARAEEQAHSDAGKEQRREDEVERQQQGTPEETGGQATAHERDHAEAQALLAAQDAETERHFAEMEQEIEAEQAAGTGRKETREPERRRDKEEVKARARAAAAAHAIEAEAEEVPAAPVYRTPVKWGRPAALALFLLLVLGLVLVHFVSFDGYIPRFEKLAGAYLQQPVKIKALHLSLLPLPHWRLDGVSVGTEGQLKVEKVNATAGLGSMFSDTLAFTLIELESPVLGEKGLTGLLFGKPAGQDFKVANIIVKNGKLDSKTFVLPALDAKIAMAENGAWQKIALETPDHKTSLLLSPEGEGAQLEVETNVFSLPFDPSFFLENFSAKGVIRGGELRLSELKGGIYGGFLSGNARLKWDADWSLTGEVSVRTLDPGRFAPALFEEGALEGKAAYAMRAKAYDQLFAAPRLEGNFEMRKGTLLGVDLGRLLQGGGVGGKTAYAELAGSFVHEAGKTQVRQMRLSGGPVSAGGSVEADAKRINGRFAVELKSPVAQARSNLTLSGTLREPRFSR